MTSDVPLSEAPPSEPAPVSDVSEADVRFMKLALALGRRGLGNAWPNPAVGAIVVQDGIIIGRGWTQPGGRPHAETEALRHAGRGNARGGTLYVTLEPCSHHGKTPPCVDAILRTGIARVVSAIEDPNPEVAGRGHAMLREKGVEVVVGVCGDEARRVHDGHIRRMRDGRPHVLLKLAVTADNKAGALGRKPVAITGEEVRRHVHLMRAQADAIMVGIGTILADDPVLNCRLPGLDERSPVRVVLDARLRTPMSAGVVGQAHDRPTWIFCGPQASPVAESILRAKGLKVFRVAEQDGRLDLQAVLKTLAAEGITRVMVEGGPTLAAELVAADLVDEAVLMRAPKVLGEGIEALQDLPLTALTESTWLTRIASESLGVDTMEVYERAPCSPES